MRDEEIHGRRVALAPLRERHASELVGLLDDDFVRDTLGVGDVEGLRRRFAAWESRRSPDGGEAWLNWVVRGRDDGRALGWARRPCEARRRALRTRCWPTSAAGAPRATPSER
jgi:hypothetical protein